MITYTFVKGDQLPALEAIIKYTDGTAFNLTDCTVKFNMRLYSGRAYAATYKVSAAATVTNALSGQVQYTWAAADLDTTGEYHCEFEVTSSGKTQTTSLFCIMVRDQMG